MKIPITKPIFDEQEIQAVSIVLQSGWLVQGLMVENFEKAFSDFTGVNYSKAVTSCTTALHIALAIEGITNGDDVIVPSFTFIATANAIEYTGATPVFCDIDIRTYNISINNVESLINNEYAFDDNLGFFKNKLTGNRLKAIMPVHLFGLPADIIEINNIAKRYNLTVIEDAACALGGRIKEKHIGSFGNMACYSLHPRKAITTGEGGMITTDSGEYANNINVLRNHGAEISDLQRHNHSGYLLPEYNYLGYNYRMTDIQGAIGYEQMKKASWIINERKKRAEIYDKELTNIDYLTPPFVPNEFEHGYQSYVCLLNADKLNIKDFEEASKFRNELMHKLDEKGISTRQGTHAVHMLNYYKKKYAFKDHQFINSYKADRLTITLPLYANMTDTEQEYVINQLKLML
ncbi:MAG: DegT/DnrJ/EryC1/StrS family aminotransferase [Deltaproteobacteria bacterium]